MLSAIFNIQQRMRNNPIYLMNFLTITVPSFGEGQEQDSKTTMSMYAMVLPW